MSAARGPLPPPAPKHVLTQNGLTAQCAPADGQPPFAVFDQDGAVQSRHLTWGEAAATVLGIADQVRVEVQVMVSVHYPDGLDCRVEHGRTVDGLRASAVTGAVHDAIESAAAAARVELGAAYGETDPAWATLSALTHDPAAKG